MRMTKTCINMKLSFKAAHDTCSHVTSIPADGASGCVVSEAHTALWRRRVQTHRSLGLLGQRRHIGQKNHYHVCGACLRPSDERKYNRRSVRHSKHIF